MFELIILLAGGLLIYKGFVDNDLLAGIVGVSMAVIALLAWWARKRYDRSIRDAERQASKRRAELIDKAYDKLHGDSHE